MAKKRRKHKKRRAKTPEIQKFAGVYIAQHPFNRVDKDDLRAAVLKMGEDAVRSFDSEVAELQQMLDSVDALQAAACLAVYGLTVGVTAHGEMGKSYKGDKFTQEHVEIALAFALRTPFEARGRETAGGDVVTKLFELLPKVSTTFSRKRLVRGSGVAENERAIAMLQEHLRLHTQVVRNWGYYDEVIGTIKQLVAPMDEAWERVYGLSASFIVQFFVDRVEEMEQRLTERLNSFREIAAASSTDDFLTRLFARFPTTEAYQNSFAEAVRAHPPLSKTQRGAAVFQYTDAFLHLYFFVAVSKVAEQYNVDSATLDKVFAKLGLAFGDLNDTPADRLLLSNPVWTHPLVSLGDGVYCCILPQSFFSFAFQILGDLAEKDQTLAKSWSERRARFLEAEIEKTFREAFSSAVVVPKFKWRDGDTEYENDLLIQVGSHLIIVEAKSGSVSWPALRGAPDRAKKHFQELILDPSIQSTRLMERIDGPNGERNPPTGFPFDLCTVKRVLRLSVTLEDFGVLQTNIAMAVEAGWVPSGHRLPPTMILGDLKAAFHILSSRAERIHYLQRRHVVQTSIDYIGDEMDLLGLYLANGFDVGSIEGSDVHLNLTGMSSPIDQYLEAKASGFSRDKPQRKLTKWWRDICAKFNEREFEGWTEASAILLEVGYDQQRKFESKFRGIKRNVMRNWQEPDHLSSSILIPSESKSDAVVAYAFRDAAAGERRNAMESVASQIFAGHPHVNRCLVLGVNIDKAHYPYTSLAIFFR
jgi:hypothetical protein